MEPGVHRDSLTLNGNVGAMHALVGTMTWPTFYVGAASAVFAGIPIIAFALRHLWKALVHQVAWEVADINRKVTPNGGTTGTIGDRVARIEFTVAALASRLDVDHPPPVAGKEG